LRAIGSLVDNRYPHENLAHTAWQLRHNLTYYDALYVALATRLGSPLLTADARLARSPGLPCSVELVD
jgi:predicted nucleic acid-binding protein